MRKLAIAVLIWVGVIFLTLSGNFSFLQERHIFRRIRQPEPAEFILEPTLAEPVSVSLLLLLFERLPLDGLIKNLGEEFSPATWKIGLILAILKDIKGLGLENLNIANWIEKNHSSISPYLPDDYKELKPPTASQPFERIRDIAKVTAEEVYKGIQNSIIDFYFLDFIERTSSLQPTQFWEDSLAAKEKRHLHTLQDILGLPFLRTRHPGVSEIIPPNYNPDLWRLGELRTPDPSNQKYAEEIEKYLLGTLLKGELEGYAQRYLRTLKYGAEISALMVEIRNSDIATIKRELQSYCKTLSDSNPEKTTIMRLLSTGEDGFLRNLLIERVKIPQLIKADMERFVQDNLPIVRRIIYSAFYFTPTSSPKIPLIPGTPLIDNLTIAEAEYLVRRILKIYFHQIVNQVREEGERAEDFDPHIYANKHKNRLALLDWKINVLPKIEEIKETLGSSAEPYRVHRVVIYYLLKKLATAGAYDLSLAEIRQVYEETGSPPGWIDSGSVRAYPWAISAFNKLLNEVLFSTYSKDPAIRNQKIRLVIGADNHGEIINLLGLVQEALQINPNITIYLVPRRGPVADDAYYTSVWQILKDDWAKDHLFNYLYEQLHYTSGKERRFFIVKDGPDIQGDDLRCISEEEFKVFTKHEMGPTIVDKIVYLGIGNANFVSTQGLNLERYYLLRVKAKRVEEAIGISREGYPLILAYVDKKVCIGTSFGIERFTTLLQYVAQHKEFYDPPRGTYVSP